uniref:Uncharacterized protein n=1 Tax=Eutreptiella gymnastica TaxID=73025 RepID=A0A7S1IP52_9EUGL|mmetsp:Transcript_33233/g.59522  ORF Transcript_33233/g.59522 Transcript_33233/m.59522 type:complete len:164 (+) Transcript_33233:71-562(+)
MHTTGFTWGVDRTLRERCAMCEVRCTILYAGGLQLENGNRCNNNRCCEQFDEFNHLTGGSLAEAFIPHYGHTPHGCSGGGLMGQYLVPRATKHQPPPTTRISGVGRNPTLTYPHSPTHSTLCSTPGTLCGARSAACPRETNVRQVLSGSFSVELSFLVQNTNL